MTNAANGSERGINPYQRRTLLAGAVGNAIEFYDFIVYAYLAGYFAAQFFRACRSRYFSF